MSLHQRKLERTHRYAHPGVNRLCLTRGVWSSGVYLPSMSLPIAPRLCRPSLYWQILTWGKCSASGVSLHFLSFADFTRSVREQIPLLIQKRDDVYGVVGPDAVFPPELPRGPQSSNARTQSTNFFKWFVSALSKVVTWGKPGNPIKASPSLETVVEPSEGKFSV